MNKHTAIAVTFGVISMACIFAPIAAIGFIFAMLLWGLIDD